MFNEIKTHEITVDIVILTIKNIGKLIPKINITICKLRKIQTNAKPKTINAIIIVRPIFLKAIIKANLNCCHKLMPSKYTSINGIWHNTNRPIIKNDIVMAKPNKLYISVRLFIKYNNTPKNWKLLNLKSANKINNIKNKTIEINNDLKKFLNILQ